jgi:hypothetical protein
VVAVTTYNVRAKRWAHGWELHIDEVGVTQSRSLSDAERMVRDYIALDCDADPYSFDVAMVFEMGDGLDEEIAQARTEQRRAEDAQARAAERFRGVARRLRDRGLAGADMAAVLGVTPQRVSQLVGVRRADRKSGGTGGGRRHAS